ncbi:FkbM family methyltransferase [Stieleria varia]|uniref:Methyltransferase FkbM domain-containing protein n=1 Tax=Stieleria varia TaxID=2528005 RepID=A0A5C6AMK4_9BACT|nr:FkbM family methyltransferase [Stieleria varia]TWU00890.1 hypothetical protein Pla52n_42590 [Stieleria varia]
MHFDFIQIGSHIGRTFNDPLYASVTNGQRGILVEPVPYLFDQLVANYRGLDQNLILINKAVGAQSGTLRLFIPSPKNDFTQFPRWASQLASAVPGHVESHFADLIIDTIEVPMTTMNELIQEHDVDRLTTLFVDTEGNDFAILMSMDLKHLRPQRIHFENKHTDGPHQRGEKYRQLIAHLLEQGYHIESEDDKNTVVIDDHRSIS